MKLLIKLDTMLMNTPIKYPNKLRELRKAKGLRQIDVTRYLGNACEDRICRWEKGIAIPNLINAIKLCKLFNVRIEELYPDILEAECN